MTFRFCTFRSSNFCKILKSHFSIDANAELSKDGQNLANAALKCMEGDSHVLYSSSDSNIKTEFISYLSYQLYCCTLPDKNGLSHGMSLYHDDVARF